MGQYAHCNGKLVISTLWQMWWSLSSHFPIALINYTSKSNLIEKGHILFTASRWHSPSWRRKPWQQARKAQGKDRRLVYHTASTFRKHRVTHGLQYGLTPKGSTTFPNRAPPGDKVLRHVSLEAIAHTQTTTVNTYPRINSNCTVPKEHLTCWIPYLDLRGLWNARLRS